MPTKNKIVPYVIARGLDAGMQNPHLSESCSLIKNGVFKHVGGLDKRHGLDYMQSTYSEYFIGAWNNQLCAWDTGFSVLTNDGKTQVDADLFITDVVSEMAYSRKGEAFEIVDSLISNGLRVQIFNYDLGTHSMQVGCRVIQDSTGVFLDEELLNSGVSGSGRLEHGRVCETSSGVYVAYFNGGYPCYRAINTTTGEIGAETQLTSGITPKTSSRYGDICVAGSIILYLYPDFSGDWHLVNSWGVQRLIACTSGGACCVEAWGTDSSTGQQRAILAHEDTVTNYVTCRGIRADTLADVVSAANQAITGDALSLTAVPTGTNTVDLYVGDDSGSSTGDSYRTRTWEFGNYSGTGSNGTLSTLLERSFPISAPYFSVGKNKSFVWVHNFEGFDEDATALLIDNAGNIVAKANCDKLAWPMKYVGSFWSAFHFIPVPQVQDLSGIGFQTSSIVTSALDEAGLSTTAVYLSSATNHTVSTKNEMFLSGGLPYFFDGTDLVEANFVQDPQVTASLNGSGALAAGTYSYKVTYEYTAKGNTYRSPESEAATVTLSSSDSVDLVISTLCATRKQNVKAMVWRTQVDSDFYQLAAILDNDPTVPFLTLTDQKADSTLGEALYTESVLGNVQIRPHLVSAQAGDRVFYVPRDEQSTKVCYSKTFVNGEGLCFHGEGLISVPAAGGYITGLASYLDKLVIFKMDRIYIVQGQGLSDDGQGSDYSIPYLVSPSVGCANQESIAQIPDGLLFLSQRGIELLGSDMVPQVIGLSVKYYTDNNTIVGAHVFPDSSDVVFTTDDEAIVYNYLFASWTVWDGHACNSSTVIENWVPSTLCLKSGNDILVQSDGYLDGEDYISLELVSPWFNLGQMGGFQRIKGFSVIGQNNSDHVLNSEIGWDGDVCFQDEQEWPSSGVNTYGSSAHYDAIDLGVSYDQQSYRPRFYNSKQKGTAYRVHLWDEGDVGHPEDDDMTWKFPMGRTSQSTLTSEFNTEGGYLVSSSGDIPFADSILGGQARDFTSAAGVLSGNVTKPDDDEMSIGAFIYLDSTTQSGKTLEFGPMAWEWDAASNDLNISTVIAGGSDLDYTITGLTVGWHHILVAIDVDSAATVIVDGVEEYTQALGSGRSITWTTSMSIGNLDGYIDDLTLYSKAKTATWVYNDIWQNRENTHQGFSITGLALEARRGHGGHRLDSNRKGSA